MIAPGWYAAFILLASASAVRGGLSAGKVGAMTDIQLALVVIGLGLGLLALAAYMRRVLGL